MYVPVDKQCWLASCKLRAVEFVVIKEQTVKVCADHAVTYRTSYEKELRNKD